VVDGADNVEFELAVGCGLEDSCVDFDLFDAGPIQLFEGRDDPGFLTCTGGAIDEEVREVAALSL
jgi:hypothetical protein